MKKSAAAAVTGAVLAGGLMWATPAQATAPDVCHLQIVPGHNSDRITRIWPKGRPKLHEHKPYYMAGHFEFETRCSTHNFVKASYFDHAAAVWYTLPAAKGAHKPRDVQFLDGRTTSWVTKQHQLVIKSEYTWPLTCSRRAGAITYTVHFRGDINRGPEPTQYTYDNHSTGHGKTHVFHNLCGEQLHT